MLGIACVGEREPRAHPQGKRPDGRRGTGRSLVVSDQRCKERQRGGRNTTDCYYNSSAHRVKHDGYDSQFRFSDFWRSVEGSIWGVVWATTPFIVSMAECQQCFQACTASCLYRAA